MKRFLRNIVFGLFGLLVLIQLIPVERDNPAVTQEVLWNAPETRALAQRACFDCHSNETIWPWYAYVAPLSIRVANHVHAGREHLNFSAWDQPNEDFEEIEEVISRNEMPLSDYLLMHTAAQLTDTEKQTLIAGFRETLVNDPPIARSGSGSR